MKRSPVRVRLEAQSKNQDFQNITKAYQSISLFSFANVTNCFAPFPRINFSIVLQNGRWQHSIFVCLNTTARGWRLSISTRFISNWKSVYLKTDMYATRSQISKDFSTVKDRSIARSIDRKLQEYEELIVQKLGWKIHNRRIDKNTQIHWTGQWCLRGFIRISDPSEFGVWYDHTSECGKLQRCDTTSERHNTAFKRNIRITYKGLSNILCKR